MLRQISQSPSNQLKKSARYPFHWRICTFIVYPAPFRVTIYLCDIAFQLLLYYFPSRLILGLVFHKREHFGIQYIVTCGIVGQRIKCRILDSWTLIEFHDPCLYTETILGTDVCNRNKCNGGRNPRLGCLPWNQAVECLKTFSYQKIYHPFRLILAIFLSF